MASHDKPILPLSKTLDSHPRRVSTISHCPLILSNPNTLVSSRDANLSPSPSPHHHQQQQQALVLPLLTLIPEVLRTPLDEDTEVFRWDIIRPHVLPHDEAA